MACPVLKELNLKLIQGLPQAASSTAGSPAPLPIAPAPGGLLLVFALLLQILLLLPAPPDLQQLLLALRLWFTQVCPRQIILILMMS
jgi:hypothetical protein